MKLFKNTFFNKHTILITILVYVVMTVSSWIPFNFKALNPFKKSLKDYDATDIVFSQFKDKNAVFDDRIVLVNVGKPDRQEINSMVNIIQGYQPSVIGIDIHFEDFNKTQIDTTLRNTFIKSKVILSKRLVDFDKKSGEFLNLEGCHDFFCDSTEIAFTNFYARPDMTIRRFSPVEKVNSKYVYGIGTALAISYDPSVEEAIRKRSTIENINYIGDKDAFINVDKSQILEGKQNLQETFRNKIVILGYLGADEWTESVNDKFITPMGTKLASKYNPDMYGVTIHANIAHMILEGEYINKLSKINRAIVNFILILLLVVTFNKIYNTINPGYFKIIKVIQLLLFAVLFLIVSGVLYFFNLKLELGVGIIGAVLSWDVVKWYNYLYIKRQKFFKSKK